MAGTLPTKNNNNLKLFLSNSVDSLRNTLKQGISRNPQAMKKSCGQRQLSATRTIKPPGNQSSKRQVIPFERE